MKTTVERVDDVTIKMSVEVEPARVKKAFDEAAKHIAKDVRLPGFRPGKAPRRMLEAKFGKDVVRGHAIDDALGGYYAEALRGEGLDPVSTPDVDLDVFDEAEGCRFEATFEVVPDFEVPDHEGLSIVHPEWDVTDEDVDEQVERLRDQFARNEDVDRPAADGDYVTIDLKVSVDGEPLEDATVEDALYEVGSGGVTPKLDEELPGASAGDVLTYTDVLPEDYPGHGGSEATFEVTVKNVAERVVPDLDDDFAQEASEHETYEALRKSLRDGLLRRSISEATQELRNAVVERFLAGVELPLPPTLVTEERERRQELLDLQARQMGVEPADVLAQQDMTLEEWEAEQDDLAAETVKAALVLEAFAKKMDLQVTNQDLDREVYVQAQRYGLQPQQVVEILQQNDSLQTLVGDAVRRKAIDALVDATEVTDGPSDDVLIELGLKPDPEAIERARAEAEAAIEEQTVPVDEAEDADEDEASSSSSSASDDSADSDGSAEAEDAEDEAAEDEPADEEE